ncbi:hypothetical protein LCGC14_1910390 [marine sediment metagenome]|uniref:Uncharacterized protein n=1 Tax=marine sediment metagenome TaxID=412755 RepID=A0A0F9I7S4_9ZZZZ
MKNESDLFNSFNCNYNIEVDDVSKKRLIEVLVAEGLSVAFLKTQTLERLRYLVLLFPCEN